MVFKKGLHNSPETEFKKGIRASPETEFRKGNVPLNKGKPRSEDTKRKQKEKMEGKEPWNKDKRGIYSEKTRRQISEKLKGEKSNLWKGGITPINMKIRNNVDLKLWREEIFKRDNFTCVLCGVRSGNGKTVILNAHHIKPFSLFPELRFTIDNGRTLCIDCHKKTDSYLNNKITNATK